jgi:hypothetical protein
MNTQLRWSAREAKVRAIAETLWTRDPLAFLAICAAAKDHGTTLLARIRQRMAELEAARWAIDRGGQ